MFLDELQHLIRHFDGDALVHGDNPSDGTQYTIPRHSSPALALAAQVVIL
jgi:hypothetical protein